MLYISTNINVVGTIHILKKIIKTSLGKWMEEIKSCLYQILVTTYKDSLNQILTTT